MSNLLGSYNLGQSFMIAGYQITKIKKENVWMELYNDMIVGG